MPFVQQPARGTLSLVPEEIKEDVKSRDELPHRGVGVSIERRG
jgi:hypothetical protein